jgi:hypothetical protein
LPKSPPSPMHSTDITCFTPSGAIYYTNWTIRSRHRSATPRRGADREHRRAGTPAAAHRTTPSRRLSGTAGPPSISLSGLPQHRREKEAGPHAPMRRGLLHVAIWGISASAERGGGQRHTSALGGSRCPRGGVPRRLFALARCTGGRAVAGGLPTVTAARRACRSA